MGDSDMRNGIAVAGNMVMDISYPISGYPKPGELTTIHDGISYSTGGALCNVIMSLAHLDGNIPLAAIGRVGTDKEGDMVLEKLNAFSNIDSSSVKREGITSFTAVMADTVTKQRTFFHYRGANAAFNIDDIDFSRINAKILHIGYILLLDTLDSPDAVYGTKMAELLHHAQASGLKTSIDVVSETGDRFKRLVPPALKYTDYCVINEVEAQASTGITLRSDTGTLVTENIPAALKSLINQGVSTWAVIHCPEGGFGMDADGSYVTVKSLKLPDGFIKGTVGAGDAFAAGVLYGAHEGRSLKESIEYGTASAACSLSQFGATESVLSIDKAMELYKKLR
jgi:sugar/nucleoside kinase (ribokinase family)